uniref:Monoglyceride lipase n=1 Tax=Anthurium amnicola TaxID=1678845 RepID=A0A1D1ZFF7_9ARAE
MEKMGYDVYEEFVLNSRGLKLFTCRWVPEKDPIALVFLCHGYAMECSVSMKGTATRLVEAGYAVYGIDYEGHGRSSGLQGYVRSFDNVVDDCSDYFTSICEMPENRGKQRFLLGESMGGAVTLLLHRKKPTFWDGAVLVAPMCKISDDMKPPAILVNMLGRLSRMFPTWKVVPTQNIVEIAIKTKERRDEVRCNPYCYKGRPRLKTAHELLMASLDVEKNLCQVLSKSLFGKQFILVTNKSI